MDNKQLQDEVLRLKARLFELSELEKERDAVRNRLLMLLGKAEAYAEMKSQNEIKNINDVMGKVAY
jgi:uncharacterized protein involved in exopolysaccharide biosynthesis